MLRLIAALILIAVLAMGAVWLVENPGAVDLSWGDLRIQTSVPVVVVALILMVGIFLGIFRLIGWILASPGRFREYLRGNRDEKGYRALTEGMAAIASGDWRQAGKAADRADRFLDSPPMSRLLKAQAAQLAGDDEGAETHFRAMLGTPETELVALRGLLIQAGQMGDHDRALELAKKAHRLRPDAGWAQRALFDLQTAGADWLGAVQTLITAVRNGVYDKERGAHLRSVLETAIALDEERSGHLKPALNHAEAALKQQSDHVPAILTEARLQKAAGRDRRANKHLTEAWGRLKHPDIGRAILELRKDEDPSARLSRFESANKTDMDDAETQLMLGRLALEADNAALARDYGLAAADRASIVDQRFCRLMVDAAERTDNGAEEARDWLMRLADAPLPPRWQCVHCNTAAQAWEPLCTSCGHFDGLEWRDAEPMHEAVLLVEQDRDEVSGEIEFEEAVASADARPTRP
jgi:HemY protein